MSEKTIKSIVSIIISNIIKLTSGVVVAFMIPKFLSLSDYGYFKIFVLYMSYAGLFHFGFIDGIYLKYGGYNFDRLEKGLFRSFFRYLILLVLLISVLLLLFSFFIINSDLKTILFLLSLNLLSVHITGYFQMLSQITSRFKELSQRTIVIAIGNLVITGFIGIFGLNNFTIYIGLITLLNYIISFWYIFTYRKIIFGESYSLKSTLKENINLSILGIPLLFSNLATTIATSIDKQIVDIFFEVESFAIYSFAYSMLSIITVVITAIGIVLYPILKKTSSDNAATNYSLLNSLVIGVVIIGLIGYFPLIFIIPLYLPDYVDSLQIFRVALPGLIMTSSISIVKHNFYKILNKNVSYFILSFIAIIITASLNLIAYYLYGTMISIAISSIIGAVAWYASTEIMMNKLIHMKWIKNMLLISLGMGAFYVTTSIDHALISAVSYFLFLLFILLFFYKKEVKNLITKRNIIFD